MCQISEEVKVKVEVDFTPTGTAVMMWSKKKHWNLLLFPVDKKWFVLVQTCSM